MDKSFVAFRATRGMDLYNVLKYDILRDAHDDASFAIVTCVGSLTKCVVRLAGATPENQQIVTINGPLEIVSLVGTVTRAGVHIHICVSDKDGNAKGGHLMPGSVVDTTAEIVLANLMGSGIRMTRAHDPMTGFSELKVENLSS